MQIFDNWVQPGDSFVGLFMKAEPGGPRGDSMFFFFFFGLKEVRVELVSS